MHVSNFEQNNNSFLKQCFKVYFQLLHVYMVKAWNIGKQNLVLIIFSVIFSKKDVWHYLHVEMIKYLPLYSQGK